MGRIHSGQRISRVAKVLGTNLDSNGRDLPNDLGPRPMGMAMSAPGIQTLRRTTRQPY
jgi:hypothetical protein